MFSCHFLNWIHLNMGYPFFFLYIVYMSIRLNKFSSSITSSRDLFWRQFRYIHLKQHREIFAVPTLPFPMYVNEFVYTWYMYCICILYMYRMTAMRSVKHLWRARSNRDGVSTNHNSLIVFQICDNQRHVVALDNLLSRMPMI